MGLWRAIGRLRGGIYPLCKDCRWAVPGEQGDPNFPPPLGRAQCRRPQYPNRVSGVVTYLDVDAFTERSPIASYGDHCGPLGRYFEARVPKFF